VAFGPAGFEFADEGRGVCNGVPLFFSAIMKHNDTQKYGLPLKTLSAAELDKLLSSVLQEMRRRDSDNIKGDVVSVSQTLRAFRSTNKLPDR
jgi:hypothetical protein